MRRISRRSAGIRGLRYITGNAADVNLLEAVISGSKADAEDGIDEVYHLAAAVGVALVAADPMRTIETNIAPTERLLAAIRRRHAQGKSIRLFLSSTSEVYGKNPKPQWTEEDDLVFGPTVRARWSYGVSKAIDEFLVLAAWRQERLPVVVGRLFNVVGTRQTGRYGMVLPRLVAAALAGQRPVVHDDGRQVRCFAHVADVVRAIMASGSNARCGRRRIQYRQRRAGEHRGIGKTSDRGNRSAVGNRISIYADAYSNDFEDVRRRVPDLSKLRRTIDFQLQFDLDQIIAEVIAWQRRVGFGASAWRGLIRHTPRAAVYFSAVCAARASIAWRI